jgi:hypothetical protein
MGSPPLNCLPNTLNRERALGKERKPVLKHMVTDFASPLMASYAISVDVSTSFRYVLLAYP